MKKTLNILVCLLVVCLVLALTLNILFITGVVSGASGAQGEKGETGATGAPGKDGEDGKTPKIEIKEGFWWIDGENTGVKAVPDKVVETDTLPDPSDYYDGDMCVIPYNSSFVKGTATYCLVNGVWELVEENVEPIPSDELQNENEFHINTLSELKAFRDIVNDGTNFSGKTVYLDADIDLSSEENWEPIGTEAKPFKGTFDGQNHTISNLKVLGGNDNAGLFGQDSDAHFTNVKLEHVTIVGGEGVGALVGHSFRSSFSNIIVNDVNLTGCHWMGGITGYAYGNFEDCHVSGLTAVCTPDKPGDKYDNGDKLGGLVGYLGEGAYKIANCSVKGAELTAYRDLGGLVGWVAGGATHNYTMSNNTVDNVTLTIDRNIPDEYVSVKPSNVAALFGYISSHVNLESNTIGENVIINDPLAD